MTAPDEIDIDELERGLAHDDGSAARSHLVAGRPIYYGDDCWPKEVVRKYPDGRMELVEALGKGQMKVIRILPRWTIELADRLRKTQTALANQRKERMAQMLPDEDKAYLSMLGKMQVLIAFLELPPEKVAALPATGQGSMFAGAELAEAMDADVRKFLAS